MGGRKAKLTQEEILERRTQAAWEYRQRHRDSINEKACLRMQRRREELKEAPAAVQQAHTVKARQYRRNYIEYASKSSLYRCTEHLSVRRNKPVLRSQLSPEKKNKIPQASIKRAAPVTRTPVATPPSYTLSTPPPRPALASPLPATPPTPTPVRAKRAKVPVALPTPALAWPASPWPESPAPLLVVTPVRAKTTKTPLAPKRVPVAAARAPWRMECLLPLAASQYSGHRRRKATPPLNDASWMSAVNTTSPSPAPQRTHQSRRALQSTPSLGDIADGSDDDSESDGGWHANSE
ncbi:hypothetical protein C8R46DRAFT_1050825 [Mycena filopes]|nr:hypothetical protein C8R46DRAFT_1050825 [Mycena filopes]